MTTPPDALEVVRMAQEEGRTRPVYIAALRQIRAAERSARAEAFREAAGVDPLGVDCETCGSTAGQHCWLANHPVPPHVKRWRLALRQRAEAEERGEGQG